MPNPRLICVQYSDVLSWELSSVDALLDEFEKWGEVKRFRFGGEVIEYSFEARDLLWIVTRNWRRALSNLDAQPPHRQAFVSVFSPQQELGLLPTLFFRRLGNKLPPNIHLLVHSQLNYRYFTEIEEFPKGQISFVQLPYLGKSEEPPPFRESRSPVVVGTVGTFNAEANHHFFLNICHYISMKRPSTRFRIVGSGPLYGHLADLIGELGLHKCVDLVESSTLEEVAGINIFLYLPLRNDHYIPLMLGAQNHACLCTIEIPGVNDLVVDAHSGFILPVNETKPIAELTLRLIDHFPMRRALTQSLSTSLSRFSPPSLFPVYREIFFSGQKADYRYREAA